MRPVLRLADPDGDFAAVRLASDLHLSERERSFRRSGDEWVLELPEPRDIERLEYKLEVERSDGGTDWLLDPGNPNRAPGAFGDKSVLELPGYAPPDWLDAEGVPGRTDDLAVRGRGLGAHIQIRVWSPADAAPGRPLRLLLANDGPEYDALSRLSHFCAVAIAREELPPFRVALLAPGDRDQWYSASAGYSRALANDVIPALQRTFGLIGRPAGMGASLGGLAMLHVQRRFPTALAGLFLQSASLFTPRHDGHERGFARYARIVRFVRDTRRDGRYAIPVPVTLTCGIAEENLHNNREMATALAAQGYEVSLVEVPDLHNYVGWRDAFAPHLTELLRKAWLR